jgi:hypothetical protein
MIVWHLMMARLVMSRTQTKLCISLRSEASWDCPLSAQGRDQHATRAAESKFASKHPRVPEVTARSQMETSSIYIEKLVVMILVVLTLDCWKLP